MGKICYINGQPYMVSVPTGGKSEADKKNQWDGLIKFLGEDCNDILHWKDMYSWAQEEVTSLSRVLRGYSSACYWCHTTTWNRDIFVCFRPVLSPLNADTLKPDPSLLDDIPDGRVFALASLYMDRKVVENPENPVEEGDIPDYIPGAEITLGDRDLDKTNWLYVIKYQDLLWADRNILKGISWDDLKDQGFISEE